MFNIFFLKKSKSFFLLNFICHYFYYIFKLKKILIQVNQFYFLTYLIKIINYIDIFILNKLDNVVYLTNLDKKLKIKKYFQILNFKSYARNNYYIINFFYLLKNKLIILFYDFTMYYILRFFMFNINSPVILIGPPNLNISFFDYKLSFNFNYINYKYIILNLIKNKYNLYNFNIQIFKLFNFLKIYIKYINNYLIE